MSVQVEDEHADVRDLEQKQLEQNVQRAKVETESEPEAYDSDASGAGFEEEVESKPAGLSHLIKFQ